MSNVNDNNLDDLLRRAAEKYPLRTNSADWERLAADLEKDPSLVLPPVEGEDRRRRRRFLWLFLLLPLAGGGYYIWQGIGKSASGQHTVGQANVPAADPVGKGGTAGKGEIVGQPAVPGETRKDETSGEVETVAKGTTIGKIQSTGQPTEKGKSTAQPTEKSEAVVKGKTAREGKNGHTVGGNDLTGKNNLIGETGLSGESNPTGESGLSGVNNLTKVKGRTDEKELRLAGNHVQMALMRGNVAVNIPVRAGAVSQIKGGGKKDNIRLQKPKPSLYVGILGSPDLSSIKFQSVKNVGSRYGLLLGYRFNSRWSVETGISYGKKKYFTDGEYFDKTNAYILKYVDQLKVEGVCTMWEIPVNIRYDLSSGEKMKWFVTAGVSTYYMSKEQYDCWGYLNGSPWQQGWNQKPSRNSWSSNLNLSVGYEQRLGRVGNLRLEPYVRVPMSGIGTGKLSIMSAGLNIGITRRIW